jgi:hypothetical protein
MTWERRYKVLRNGEVWSLGYPSKGSAEAAARRLNKGHPRHPIFTSRPMDPYDFEIMRGLEEF